MSLVNLGVLWAHECQRSHAGHEQNVHYSFGWRVAMLLSVVIVIPALLARCTNTDSPLFERIKQADKLVALPSFEF